MGPDTKVNLYSGQANVQWMSFTVNEDVRKFSTIGTFFCSFCDELTK